MRPATPVQSTGRRAVKSPFLKLVRTERRTRSSIRSGVAGDLPGGGGLGARRRRGSFRVDASDPPLSRMVPSCPLVGHAPGPGARRQGGTPSWQQRFAGPVRGALLTTCRALARLVGRGRAGPCRDVTI